MLSTLDCPVILPTRLCLVHVYQLLCSDPYMLFQRAPKFTSGVKEPFKIFLTFLCEPMELNTLNTGEWNRKGADLLDVYAEEEVAPTCHLLSSDTWSRSRSLSQCRGSSPGWMCWWGRWCLPVMGSILLDALLLHPSQPSFPRAGISLGFFPSETHLKELDFKKKKNLLLIEG